ncbi:MAG: GntR family transcriptional regulator [Lacrimispora sp.]
MTKYEFLAKQLKERIETGVYRKGERLPTENELAKSYDISRHTVRQALVKLKLKA